MEIGGCLCLIPILMFENTADYSKYFSFIVPFMNDNLMLVSIAGVIYGIIRVIGAAGLYKNRMWGLVLSCINCVITLALMIFMLPAGIADGILAGTALILMLKGYFGDKVIEE